jgi:phage gp46-like protein
VVNGRPVEDGTLNTPAYIRLKTERTRWMYAPDAQFGADFYLFHRRHLLPNDNAMIAVAQRALQPLIDDGRASAVQVAEQATAREAFELAINITQANGVTTPLTFQPVTN